MMMIFLYFIVLFDWVDVNKCIYLSVNTDLLFYLFTFEDEQV